MIVTTFSNLSWRKPSIAHFVSVPHLIQLSLLETVRPEVCVSDKGDSIQKSRHQTHEVHLKTLWQCHKKSLVSKYFALLVSNYFWERELGPLWPNQGHKNGPNNSKVISKTSS